MQIENNLISKKKKPHEGHGTGISSKMNKNMMFTSHQYQRKERNTQKCKKNVQIKQMQLMKICSQFLTNLSQFKSDT